MSGEMTGCEPKIASPLDRELDTLENSLMGVRDQTNRLIKLLEPLLGPESEAKEPSALEGHSSCSPLVEKITTVSLRLKDIEKHLSNTACRLEL